MNHQYSKFKNKAIPYAKVGRRVFGSLFNAETFCSDVYKRQAEAAAITQVLQGKRADRQKIAHSVREIGKIISNQL